MSKLFTARALAAALLLCSFSCKCSCDKAQTAIIAGKTAEEFIASDSFGTASVPSLGLLADKAQALITTLRTGEGGDKVVAAAANMATQLGFDPLTREGLTKAGLDPDRSLAFGSEKGAKTQYMALPIGNQTVLEETIKRLVGQRAGASIVETRTIEDISVTVLTTAAGAQPVVTYVPKDGFLLVGSGANGAQAVVHMMKLDAANSVAKKGLFADAKQKVGPRELYVMIPKIEGNRVSAALPDVFVLGLGIAGNELSLKAYLGLNEAQQKLSKTALLSAETPLSRLPPEAPLYARGSINWSGLLAEAEKNPETKQALDEGRAKAKELSIDLDKDLIGNLNPGFALSIGLSPTIDVSKVMDLNPRRNNPFQNFTFIALGSVKDSAIAQELLKKISPIVEMLGNTLTSRDLNGSPIYTANYRLGEGLSWTVRGNDLILAGGLSDKIDAMMTALSSAKETLKPDAFSPRAKDVLFSNSGLGTAIDFGRIAQEVQKLPEESFGTGPNGMMAKVFATGIIQPLSRLKLMLGLAPVDGGVTVDLTASVK